MSQEKYIGMDVHQATISVAVMDAQSKLIMECLLETSKKPTIESRCKWHSRNTLANWQSAGHGRYEWNARRNLVKDREGEGEPAPSPWSPFTPFPSEAGSMSEIA